MRLPLMEMKTGAVSRAKLHSNHHHQQTDIEHSTGQMPFLSPTQQCQSTETKVILAVCGYIFTILLF